MTEIMEIVQSLNVSENNLRVCQELVNNNRKLQPAFLVGANAVITMQSYSNEKDLRQICDILIELREHLRKMSPNEDRPKLGDFVAALPFCSVSYDLYQKLLKSRKMTFEEAYQNKSDEIKVFRKTLIEIRGHWWNLSDSGESFGAELCPVGILQELCQDVKALQGRDGNFLKDSYSFESAIGALHNTSKLYSLRQKFRDMKLVDCLLPFLEYPNQPKVTMLALLPLAYIADENQILQITAHNSVFKLFLDLTTAAWKNKSHYSEGFSCKELLEGMTGLSRNDQVKKVLVEKNAVALIKKILKDGNEEEKRVSADLLLELMFVEETKKILQNDKDLVRLVDKLSQSKADPLLAKACRSVMFALNMGSTQSDGKSKKSGHIMISYNWTHQKQLIKLRDKLEASGYTIWMDITHMTGDTLSAMAEAVEQSALVLVCVSERYKESPNCRLEAEYAHSRKRPMIPLMMQEKYRPDGWLGLLVGTKLYFDFSSKGASWQKFHELETEVHRQGQIEVKPHKQTGAVAKPPVRLDVPQWIKEHQLQRFSFLQTLSSDNVSFLRKLSDEAPEFYYKLLNDILLGKVNSERLTGLMQLTTAIKNF